MEIVILLIIGSIIVAPFGWVWWMETAIKGDVSLSGKEKNIRSVATIIIGLWGLIISGTILCSIFSNSIQYPKEWVIVLIVATILAGLSSLAFYSECKFCGGKLDTHYDCKRKWEYLTWKRLVEKGLLQKDSDVTLDIDSNGNIGYIQECLEQTETKLSSQGLVEKIQTRPYSKKWVIVEHKGA